MTSPLCERLGDAGLECCALAIEAFNDGCEPDVEAALAELRTVAELIQQRISLMMINEALICLEEGTISCPRDGDIGAVVGRDVEIATGQTRIRPGNRAIVFATPERVGDVEAFFRANGRA